MLTVHRAFEGEVGEKQKVYYVADGKAVKKLKGAKALAWAEKLQRGEKLLLTAAHAADMVLVNLAFSQGIELYSIHWHASGVEKGLPAQDIAEKFAAIPEDRLLPFRPNLEITKLRQLVHSRRAILDIRKAGQQRLKALGKNVGLDDDDELPPEFQAVESELKDAKSKEETPVNKDITELAQQIPECQAFNLIAGMKDGWISSAGIVSYIGDPQRFPSVAALWHYAGLHVVDGHSPKRKRGENSSWHAKLREALWQLVDSLIKNRENRWRPEYERFLTAELAAHDTKHPKCPAKQGHCGARARRRVAKEILKQYWIYGNGHFVRENHDAAAISV